MAFALEDTWQHKQNFALDNASALNLGRDMMRQLKRMLMGEGTIQNQAGSTISPTGQWVMQRSSNGTTLGTDATQATGQIQLAGSSGTVGATINGVLVTVIWGTSDTATATALASAITSSNAAAYVTAAASTTNVNLTAKNPGYVGAAGNAITLVASGTGVAVTGAGTLSGGVDPDGVDNLGDTLANYVQNSTGNAHAFYILRSAGATYAGGYAYLTVDLTGTNTFGVHLSKTYPTGGSVTAAPIASDAMSYTAQQFWEGATTNAHYFHSAMSTTGRFWAAVGKVSTGVIQFLLFDPSLAEALAEDVFPATLGCVYSTTLVGIVDNTASGVNFSYTANTVLKARNHLNTLANVVTMSYPGNYAGPFHTVVPSGGGLNGADAVNSKDNLWTTYLEGVTQSTRKGRFKDFVLVPRVRTDGNTYPSTGTVLLVPVGDLGLPANQALNT